MITHFHSLFIVFVGIWKIFLYLVYNLCNVFNFYIYIIYKNMKYLAVEITSARTNVNRYKIFLYQGYLLLWAFMWYDRI